MQPLSLTPPSSATVLPGHAMAGCFGYNTHRVPGFLILLLGLVSIPLVLFFHRTWWLHRTICCAPAGDPYDFAAVYEEFCLRAKIGHELAAKATSLAPPSPLLTIPGPSSPP